MTVVENTQPVADALAAPGRRLAEARAAQNLSQADVARQLKLSVWQVEALEAGHYHQLPGAIFVRGFIRNYARLVKLDPNGLVLALGDSMPAAVPRAESSPSRDIPFPPAGKPRWTLLALAVAVVIGLLVYYEFYWDEPDSPASPAPVATAPRPAGKVAGADASVPAAESRTPTGAPVRPAVAEATQDARPAERSPADAAAARPAKRGERQVKLAFDQECWVEIRDRNERVIFSQLNRPGTEQSITGLPPFSVVVGNAHGARLIYEDKPVDLSPHTKIDVARLILP